MSNREKLKEMLNSLTSRIDQTVQGISDADRVYADALSRAIYDPAVHAEGTPGSVARAYGSALVGTPVADSVEMRKEAIKNMAGNERLINELVQLGMPVVNIGARYGVPIAGVTAAGQGLYALGSALSGQDVQDKGTLPM